MTKQLMTISKRLVHSSWREPNGLPAVIRDVRSWALRSGWEHSHVGLGVAGSPAVTPAWTVAAEIPAELYDHYANGVISDYLWPMLHGVPPAGAGAPDLDVLDLVGARLAHRALAAGLDAGDQVWVHDFQVLAAIPELGGTEPRPRIGYFQHAPLTVEAMTGEMAKRFAGYLRRVDLVAVQTPDDAEAAGALGVEPHRILVAPVCTGERAPWGRHASKRNDRLSVLIAGRCDPTKGHVRGIEAVSQLVSSLRIPVELVVHAPPSRMGSSGYASLRDAIAAAADRARPVLSRNGGTVRLFDQVCPGHELRRHLRHANCLVIPSIADGMNLIAKEYVVERGATPSRIVLTSRTGARYSLPGAFVAEDASVHAVAETLEKAVLTAPRELAARWRENRAMIATETPSRWMTRLAASLAEIT